MRDKRMSVDDVVAELRDGMTVGIGGWGSRRKPMALVTAIAKSSLKDLTVVSYGGPDVGMLCATGKVRKAVYGFVSLDSIPLDPHFRKARQEGGIEVIRVRRRRVAVGPVRRRAAPARSCPPAPDSGPTSCANNRDLRTVDSPYDDGEKLLAMPAIHLDAALVHMNRADMLRQHAVSGP